MSTATPPSTSSKASTSGRALSVRSFSSATSSNFWPPKPGITLITSTMSQCGRLASIAESGVGGLIAKPADAPERANLLEHGPRVGDRLDVDRHDVGAGRAELRRCTRPGWRSSDARRAANRSPAGPLRRSACPKLMLGTKWPSITSRCIAATPAASTAFDLAPQFAEVAEQQRRQHGGRFVPQADWRAPRDRNGYPWTGRGESTSW